MNILSVAEMRKVERIADAQGLSYAQMMRNAGQGAAEIIRARIPTDASVLVLVGTGNNGGDGLVCATALHRAGVDVRCWLLKPRTTDDAVSAEAQSTGMLFAVGDVAVLREWLVHATVIVDALLGTGVSRPIEGELRDVLAEVSARSSRLLLISLDGPTGMNYDTGALDPATVPADLTIAFHAPKRGHYCFPAADARGELVVVPIGIERLATGDCQLVDDASVCRLLPSRKLDSNKGSHGRVLVVGGCADYVGAPTLTTRAAYRVGAGLVAYAVPQAIRHTAALLCPEATFVPLPESVEAHHVASLPHIAQWTSAIKGGAAIAIGPGMGRAEATRDFLLGFLECVRRDEIRQHGLLCDADALNHLSEQPDWPKLLPSQTVLTPHAGEMSRLTSLGIAEVQADRIGNALKFAQLWGHVVLLKGAYTVVASPSGRCAVLPFSNPAMATAGSGDVLAGCIVGLMAQGLAPFDAAVCGGYLHGKAGAVWSQLHGDMGLLAGDLLLLLPDVVRGVKRLTSNV